MQPLETKYPEGVANSLRKLKLGGSNQGRGRGTGRESEPQGWKRAQPQALGLCEVPRWSAAQCGAFETGPLLLGGPDKGRGDCDGDGRPQGATAVRAPRGWPLRYLGRTAS